jgi:hypothetical protein
MTNTPDAAKIEHGRREDPFVQSAPQGGDQSSLHPDTCRDAAKMKQGLSVFIVGIV